MRDFKIIGAGSPTRPITSPPVISMPRIRILLALTVLCLGIGVPNEAAELRVIWETPSLESNAILARDDIPSDVIDKLRKELTSLKNSESGLAAMSAMETEHIHLANDSDYEAVRDYIHKFEKEVRKVEQP